MNQRETGATPFYRAFWNQYNMILLSSVGLFSLAAGSWLPAMVGGGAELLWLVVGADSDGFRAWVRRQEEASAREEVQQKKRALLSMLERDEQERFERFEELVSQLQREMESNKSIEAALLSHESQKLMQLSFSFLALSLMNQKTLRYLNENPRETLSRELRALQESLSRERQANVKEGLQLTLSMTQKRVEQYDKMQENIRLIETKRLSMESSLRYLRSQLISAGDASTIGEELTEIINSAEMNEEVVKSIA